MTKTQPILSKTQIFGNFLQLDIYIRKLVFFWFSSIFIVLNTSILCDIKVLLDISDCIRSIALDNQNSTQFDQNSENFGQNSGFRKFNLVMLPEKRRKNKPALRLLPWQYLDFEVVGATYVMWDCGGSFRSS